MCGMIFVHVFPEERTQHSISKQGSNITTASLQQPRNRQTYCGLITPYGNTDRGQYWLWLSEDTEPLPDPLVTYHQMCSVAFVWEWFKKQQPQNKLNNLIHDQCLRLIFLKLLPHLPGANEFTQEIATHINLESLIRHFTIATGLYIVAFFSSNNDISFAPLQIGVPLTI